MTTKQHKITKRQELLSELIPGAISCEYIASVNRVLPNGFIVKSINININGFAYQLLAFKGSESKFFYSKKSVSIQGVDVYYITLHGGGRKGAGRPKLPPELKKEETVTMRIPKSKVPAVLKAIGKA